MGSYRPVNRDQLFLMPESMADWLPEDHLVWFIIGAVQVVDTSAFHKGSAGLSGRPSYDPDMLLALMCYAYACGVMSSRRIERCCATDAAFRVVCAGDAPDHTTIARFRADHEQEMIGFFTGVLRLCRELGMGRVGVVAIDGTKVAANASRGANRGQDWLREQATQLLESAKATDAGEQALFGDGQALELVGRGKARLESLQAAQARIDEQLAQAAADDAADAARIQEYLQAIRDGKPKRGRPPHGTDPVELATVRLELAQTRHGQSAPNSGQRDRASKLRKAAGEALTEALAQQAAGTIDTRGAAARERARRPLKDKPVANVTDPDSRLMNTANGGSIQGYNVQLAVSDDHLILACQAHTSENDYSCFEPMLTAATTAVTDLNTIKELPTNPTGDTLIGTVLADAGYLCEHNLTIEGPTRLIATGKNRDLPDPEDPIAAMRQQLADPGNRALYKRRSATVEPVNAHLKHHTGLNRFSRRGLPAVNSELHFAAAVVNLTRVHHRQNRNAA